MLTIEEREAALKKMFDSPYRTIEVFKGDAATLSMTVERLREQGENTDIPCLLSSLIDGYLDTLLEES